MTDAHPWAVGMDVEVYGPCVPCDGPGGLCVRRITKLTRTLVVTGSSRWKRATGYEYPIDWGRLRIIRPVTESVSAGR